MKTPYSNLSRNCQYLHNFSDRDIEKFIDLGKLKKDMVVLDAMCGDGALSKIISKKPVKLYLLDNSEFQLNKAKESIKGAEFVVSSILKTGFKDNFFDRVFIRSAIYEVPKEKQSLLYKEIFRILKSKGQFINWTWKLDEKNSKIFNELVKFKDKLAGFDDLVKNRYFMSEKELEKDLKEAGFIKVESKDIGIYYTISTKKWCEVDFKGDRQKLEEYNSFLRNILKSKESKGVEVKDLGEDIQIVVPALITIADK